MADPIAQTATTAVETPLANLSAHEVRKDIPGRFNELDILERQWLRLLGFMQGRLLPPYEVLIHPSSNCNLRCEWCIGDHVPIVDRKSMTIIDAAKHQEERLPDRLADPECMRHVIEGIISYRRHADIVTSTAVVPSVFRVEAVSFSGLIGEPLVAKAAVLNAMRALTDARLRTGIFTNGILMDEASDEVFLRIDYIHVSLDAAKAETYARLKYGGCDSGQHMFQRAVRNMTRLAVRRAATPDSPLEINASFILYPGNFSEVYDAARILKDCGVRTMRIKQDNSGRRRLTADQILHAHELLSRIEQDLVDEQFRLVRIHRSLLPSEVERRFSQCTITELMAAIGSDGQLYPCNYHPRPGGTTYGSAVDSSFPAVWEGARRQQLKDGLPRICPKTCDPFKNRANHLLEHIVALYEAAGLEAVSREKDRLLERSGRPHTEAIKG